MPKKIDKTSIFLKSSVIGLGIALVASLFVLYATMQGNKRNEMLSKCSNSSLIGINKEIDTLEITRGNIIILTKLHKDDNTQDVVKLDLNCSEVLSRTRFFVN